MNQDAKRDAGKPRLSLVPMQILWDIAEIREYGNTKYGDSENWKRVEMQRYIDAMFRHMVEFVRDNDSVDEESGLAHYKHMACNMAFICHMMKTKDNMLDNLDDPAWKFDAKPQHVDYKAKFLKGEL